VKSESAPVQANQTPRRKERYGAFLLYVDDWLSSTAIELMTAAEERGYLRLLMHAWKAEDCGLPNDHATLARLSKLGRAWRGKSGAVVRAQFTERDGRLFNDRLSREREHQQSVRQSRGDAGRKGNAIRWGSDCDPSQVAKEWQNGSQQHPNPNSNPNLNINTDGRLPADESGTPRFGVRPHPRLRDALTRFRSEPGCEPIIPSNRTVVEILEFAGGATEGEVIAYLEHLMSERGLQPGARHAPQSWSWFKTAVSRHFAEERARALPAAARALPPIEIEDVL